MKDIGPDLGFFDHQGRRLAYRFREGVSPTILFLPGYASDMEGAKAGAIDGFAAERGLAMLRFDYSGTGSSEGGFEEGTLDRWLGEALAMIDALTEGPLILVGSSMGGWIALHAALRRADRVRALVGIAAAPDFTDWGFGGDLRAELKRDGRIERGGHSTTLPFWESGQALLLLGGAIEVDCPVRLIYGELDDNVPLGVALNLARQLRSADVQLLVLKGGGHRLSEPHEIDAILRTLANLVEPAR